MQVLLAKFLTGVGITMVNALGRKYLNYEQGLKARKWLECNILTRMRALARKSKSVTLDDGLVGFIRGVLKSNAIKEGVEHASP